MNSDCSVLLRDGFKSGKIRLLVSEYDGDNLLNDVRGYSSMNPPEKLRFQMPYIHTTLLINELVNLRYEEVGGKVRIYERSGMRKDRYSSLAYNYYVATQLEAKLSRKNARLSGGDSFFIINAPKITGKAVSKSNGKHNRTAWDSY